MRERERERERKREREKERERQRERYKERERVLGWNGMGAALCEYRDGTVSRDRDRRFTEADRLKGTIRREIK